MVMYKKSLRNFSAISESVDALFGIPNGFLNGKGEMSYGCAVVEDNGPLPEPSKVNESDPDFQRIKKFLGL